MWTPGRHLPVLEILGVTMEQGQLNWVADFIWGIADDVLRDVCVRGKYRDVNHPFSPLSALFERFRQCTQGFYDSGCIALRRHQRVMGGDLRPQHRAFIAEAHGLRLVLLK